MAADLSLLCLDLADVMDNRTISLAKRIYTAKELEEVASVVAGANRNPVRGFNLGSVHSHVS